MGIDTQPMRVGLWTLLSLPYFEKVSIIRDLSTPMHSHTQILMESVLQQYTAEQEGRMLFTLSSFPYVL